MTSIQRKEAIRFVTIICFKGKRKEKEPQETGEQ